MIGIGSYTNDFELLPLEAIPRGEDIYSVRGRIYIVGIRVDSLTDDQTILNVDLSILQRILRKTWQIGCQVQQRSMAMNQRNNIRKLRLKLQEWYPQPFLSLEKACRLHQQL